MPDDAWALELSEAVPGPAAWAENSIVERHLPGAAFLVTFVPDEDPDLEPTVHIHSHDEHVIPYEIMRWLMEQVAEQVERCRIAFEQDGRQTVHLPPTPACRRRSDHPASAESTSSSKWPADLTSDHPGTQGLTGPVTAVAISVARSRD
ncbi:hypothetical protein [Streptomyces sp. XY413]|uniref:hypothetical protein n=1 Tax=Streptomyces sp. XY413 TaxID=1519479 RepID=UPI001F3F270D|nr:hypothetical protein [Streptomyces sp. XY413]